MTGRVVWTLRCAATGALLALPNVAFACPLCLASSGEATRLAFLGTMVLLTSLPLLMIGGLIYWVARRASAPDVDGEADSLDALGTREPPRLVRVDEPSRTTD